MDKPRILWIDDIYGKSQEGRNRLRDALCSRLGLKDITGDCLSREDLESGAEPLVVIDDRELPDTPGIECEEDETIADVVFCRGQVSVAGDVRNDLDGAMEVVRNGLSQPRSWSLLLLDLHFATGPLGGMGQEEDWMPEEYFGLAILDALGSDPELQNIPVVIVSAMDRNQIDHHFTKHRVTEFVDRLELDKDKLQQLLRS